jgi:hypothetical protein
MEDHAEIRQYLPHTALNPTPDVTHMHVMLKLLVLLPPMCTIMPVAYVCTLAGLSELPPVVFCRKPLVLPAKPVARLQMIELKRGGHQLPPLLAHTPIQKIVLNVKLRD